MDDALPATEPRNPLPQVDVAALMKQPFVDQFSNTHPFLFPSDCVYLLTANGEAGANQVQGWTIPIREEFGQNVRIFSIADLRTVPRFLRGRMRRQFEERWERPVILDFTGGIVSLIPMDPNQVTIMVFNRQGVVLHADRGLADEAKLAQVKQVIRKEVSPATGPDIAASSN